MRGPVGSLAPPDAESGFEQLDAGSADVTLFVSSALLEQGEARRVAFQFGLLGTCSLEVIEA